MSPLDETPDEPRDEASDEMLGRAHGERNDDAEPDPADLDRARARALRRTVLRKSMRRDRARRRRQQSTWSFLGTFGLVGWTVAVPTLLGLAIGVFLDDVTDTERSFTLTFLVAGVAVGCAMAWYWVDKERRPDDE
jgi:ATP synthase protein I